MIYDFQSAYTDGVLSVFVTRGSACGLPACEMGQGTVRQRQVPTTSGRCPPPGFLQAVAACHWLERDANMIKLLLCLLPLASCAPLEILSYSSPEGHSHTMEGSPGQAVTGEFSFKAPDTEAVYQLTYTADSEGFQAVGDHLPVPVVMEVVPEQQLPVMVQYTQEVAQARNNFLEAQMKIMEKHAMEEAENSVEHEEVFDRRRREADPVVVGPTRTLASPQLGYYPYNSLPATPYNSYPVYPTIYHPYQPYQPLTHPMSVAQTPLQVPTGSIQRLFPGPLYLTNPADLVADPFPLEGLYRGISQVAAEMPSSMIQEGEEEPAALAL